VNRKTQQVDGKQRFRDSGHVMARYISGNAIYRGTWGRSFPNHGSLVAVQQQKYQEKVH
jgi:hypothetical protein